MAQGKRKGQVMADVPQRPAPTTNKALAAAVVEQDRPAPAARPAPPPPPGDDGEGEDVIYTPLEGDPAKVKWRKIEFFANKPVRIKDPAHLEAARANKSFRVGGEEAAIDPNSPKPPKNMQYRKHWLDSMKRFETCEELIKAWSSEINMRRDMEVGDDDIRWLGNIIEPKLALMARQEGLKAQDVANVWVRYGINEIPWRAA
jgi:hypothetical protein